MKNSPYTYINQLNNTQLWNEFSNSEYYKWGTLCLLRYLGFKVLSSLLIIPGGSSSDINQAVEFFVESEKIEKILIRTDGGLEEKNYPRGGSSLTIEKAIMFINEMLNINRAVILMTPTNRFTNRLSVNIGIDKMGFFFLEFLGPGFDVSDINRGSIMPEFIVRIENINWEIFEKPHPLFITKIDNSNYLNLMRKQRLEVIGKYILPAMGIKCIAPYFINAKKWLLQEGHYELFTDKRITISYKDIRNWFEIAFIISKCYSLKYKWNHLVIGASDLGNERGTIFWDIVNPIKKFSI